MQAVGFQGHAGPVEIAAEGNEALAAWIGQYDELRARAEVGELAKVVHETLEVDESFLQSTQISGEVPDSRDEEIVQKWMPEDWAQSRDFGPNRTSDVVLQADREEIPQTLADAMDAFRRKVDDEFGWQNKKLSAKWPLFRAAVQTVLLLLDSCADDGRSELLHTKLMTLVLGEKYRAHGDVLFVYGQGAWQASGLGCLNAQDLEFLAQALRHAQAYFWAFSRHKVYRKFAQVAWELKVLLAIPDEEPLMEWQLCDVMSQKPEHKTKSWCLGLSELCRDLRKQVCDHSKGLIRAFLRWSDSSIEAKRKPGIAFADCSFLSCLCFKSATERRDRL